uniref:Uncharacterized protein n=1 Tax=viral metagenome TaxID=1070528 RepID=A0A6C0DU99_9ZZZZ
MNIKTRMINTVKSIFNCKIQTNNTNNNNTIASINKRIAELEAERQQMEDIQTKTTEVRKENMLREFDRLYICESECQGFWSAIMYEYIEEEDEDYYMDEPIFTITGENCYKCGGYLDVCNIDDLDTNGYDKHGAYRNYPDNIRCKCGKYIQWLSCHDGPPDPRSF